MTSLSLNYRDFSAISSRPSLCQTHFMINILPWNKKQQYIHHHLIIHKLAKAKTLLYHISNNIQTYIQLLAKMKLSIPPSSPLFAKETTNDILLAQDVVPQRIPEYTSAVANKVEKVNTYFSVVEDPSRRGATVIEAPVSQHGVKLYIAIDSDSF